MLLKHMAHFNRLTLQSIAAGVVMQQTAGAMTQQIQIPSCAVAHIPSCTEAQLNANTVKKQNLPFNLSTPIQTRNRSDLRNDILPNPFQISNSIVPMRFQGGCRCMPRGESGKSDT